MDYTIVGNILRGGDQLYKIEMQQVQLEAHFKMTADFIPLPNNIK